MKTAVLIHGCYLQAGDWENIVWGDPSVGRLGRASKGLQVARKEGASFIYWGTGASEKNGVKESQYTFDYAVAHCMELPEFADFNTDNIEQFFISGSFIDTESQTTLQETSNAMVMCMKEGIKRLILVSSPTHIARCLQSAEIIRSNFLFTGLEVFAVASDTCYEGSIPDDVLIVEPPHRADRAEIPLHETLKLAMFARKLDEEKALKFNDELLAFLEEQRQKLMF